MNELLDFCTRNLRDGLDPVRYAYGLVDETEDNYFEIPARDSRDGTPVTLDLRGEEV